jgi:RNA polymerase sigma-70 factor (ECF subfamily)
MMAYAARLFPPHKTSPPVFALMRPLAYTDLLICRVAEARDKAAFQELFQHFAPRVKAYLMRLGAGAQMADDLSQEALLTVWRKATLFDPAKAAAATWVFTIARNLRIDALRRERTRGLDGSDPSLLPPAEPDAGEELCAREREAALRLALRTLPAEQNQIVLLSFFSDKPHSEIAAELNIPLGTVKSRLRLAMARLRANLGEEP